MTHLLVVLETLKRNILFVMGEKSHFGQQQVAYLGHVICEQGVGVDPEKITATVEWPKPKFLKAIRGFLGPHRVLPMIYSRLWEDCSAIT